MLAGVRAARAAGLDPVKINTVLMRGVNDHEALPLLRWAMAEGVQLRFIEQMPLDAQHAWRRERDGHRRRDPRPARTAGASWSRIRRRPRAGAAPRRSCSGWRAPSYSVGIIAAVSKPFCGACDRVRLTADGQIRNCLFSRTESDLRTPLRAGASDDELADRWIRAVAGKRPGHGIDDPSFLQPDRPMSAIGG